MKRVGFALLVGLGLALALSPAEVWGMLQKHQAVEGYTATVAQGPLVYRVAFLRPRVRIDWVKGPDYLVGQAMIVDGGTVWSRGKNGRWRKSHGAAPLDPVHLLFSDFEKLRATYRLEVLGEEAGVLRFALLLRGKPTGTRSPVRWVFEVDPRDHNPLAYTTYGADGKRIARVVYRALDFTPPNPALFNVAP